MKDDLQQELQERFDELDQRAFKPKLADFKKDEVKSLRLEFQEHEGKILITVESKGMDQDPNQVALFLDFALEKLLLDAE